MSKTRIPQDPELIKAIKRYHRNKAAHFKHGKPWDKGADMQHFTEIVNAKKRKDTICYAQASVGSFWITWKCGVQSLHNEKHPEGVVVAMRTEDGKEWKKLNGVCFLTGEKEK